MNIGNILDNLQGETVVNFDVCAEPGNYLIIENAVETTSQLFQGRLSFRHDNTDEVLEDV